MATLSSISLPGESQGQRSLVGYSPWDCKESDTTEQLALTKNMFFFKKKFSASVKKKTPCKLESTGVTGRNVGACVVLSLTLWTPWAVTSKAPLSMEFSRQEYWSGLSFPSAEDLPNLGTEPMPFKSPALVGRFFFYHQRHLVSPR